MYIVECLSALGYTICFYTNRQARLAYLYPPPQSIHNSQLHITIKIGMPKSRNRRCILMLTLGCGPLFLVLSEPSASPETARSQTTKHNSCPAPHCKATLCACDNGRATPDHSRPPDALSPITTATAGLAHQLPAAQHSAPMFE